MNIKKDASISEITNYKIGGTARVLLECESRDDVFSALEYLKKEKIEKFFVMGMGTNLLFSDEPFDGAIIRIVRSQNDLITLNTNGYVTAFAGEALDNLITFSFTHNLVGLEWAGGLPGAVGGAVRGNAGAFGGEIKDTFYQAEVLVLNDSKQHNIVTFSHQDMKFDYRYSRIKEDSRHIIISATCILSNTDEKGVEEARKKYREAISYRKAHHPLEYPNCGSVFKNIVKPEQITKIIEVFPDIKDQVEGKWYGKVAMGYLIKRLGFENYRVGNAAVSQKHGNYIVNLGGATFSDVLTIIDEIKNKCNELFGFIPETEIEIIY